MKNNGLENERRIIEKMNNKYYDDLSYDIQNFVKEVFSTNIDKLKPFKAYKYYNNYKPDMVLCHNGVEKYISVKTGYSCSVHQEHVYSFLFFLIDNNCNKNIVNAFRYFQFNDDTINGCGVTRSNAYNYIESKQEEIQSINNLLNNTELKKRLIDRILFKGEYNKIPAVDFIYYEDDTEVTWASRENILEYLSSINFYSSSIHVSKIYYQVLHRNLKNEIAYEYKRNYIQFKWYSLKKDLKLISKIKSNK